MSKAIAAIGLTVTAFIFVVAALAPTVNQDGVARRRAQAIEDARHGR